MNLPTASSMSTNVLERDSQPIQRKKLPACDSCKARRVLCNPQPDGASCPRCLQRGIECTTTPVVRRRRRTKAELEKEKQIHAVVPQTNTNSKETALSQNRFDSLLLDSVQRTMLSSSLLSPPALELPASLVLELFQIFHALPQYYHPAIPIENLESSLRTCAWQLSSLAPQERVLAQCIIAVASLLSVKSLIIGPGSYSSDDVNVALGLAPFKNSGTDLREFGRRREAMCQQLRSEALRLAHQEGITAHASLENAASCSLLDFLEFRLGQGSSTSTYAAAFAYHLRSFVESSDVALTDSISASLSWAAFLMKDALHALSDGRSVPFTHNDELLVYGEELSSLQTLLECLLSHTCTSSQVALALRPMSSHTIRLARECSETLTGAYPRRRPLNEAALTRYTADLDLLHAVCVAFADQNNKFEADLLSRGNSHVSKGCMSVVRGCLILPLYNELKRRLNANFVSGIHSDAMDDETGRARPRLELLFNKIRGIAMKAAVEIAQTIAEAPTLTHFTHLQYAKLEKWAMLVLEVPDAPEITPILRVQTLERFRDALKLIGFCYIDRQGLVEAIESELCQSYLELEQSVPMHCHCAMQNGSTIPDRLSSLINGIES